MHSDDNPTRSTDVCIQEFERFQNIASFVRVMQRIGMQQETRSSGLVTTSSDHKQSSKIIKYRHIAIKWMIVIYTSCRTRKCGCDSPTSDTKCQHRSSCTPTSSQPLTTRTDTSPSCCPVWSCHAFQPSRLTFRSSMHHTRAKKIFALSWSISGNCKRV